MLKEKIPVTGGGFAPPLRRVLTVRVRLDVNSEDMWPSLLQTQPPCS